MQTRKTPRKSVTLPGRYFTGTGSPADVTLTDVSVGGCRFAVGADSISIGSRLQVYVGASGPHRATVKWTKDGDVGVTFATPLPQNEFDNLRNSHVPDHTDRVVLDNFEDLPASLPQRFC